MIAEEPEPAGEVGGEEGAINISNDKSLPLHVQQPGPFGDSSTGEGGRGRGRVVQGPQGSRPPVQETPAPVVRPTVAGAVSSGSTPTLRSVVTTIYVGVPSRNSPGTRVGIVRAEPSSTADSHKRCGEEINSGLDKQKKS